jgi:hypothetical protein
MFHGMHAWTRKEQSAVYRIITNNKTVLSTTRGVIIRFQLHIQAELTRTKWWLTRLRAEGKEKKKSYELRGKRVVRGKKDQTLCK